MEQNMLQNMVKSLCFPRSPRSYLNQFGAKGLLASAILLSLLPQSTFGDEYNCDSPIVCPELGVTLEGGDVLTGIVSEYCVCTVRNSIVPDNAISPIGSQMTCGACYSAAAPAVTASCCSGQPVAPTLTDQNCEEEETCVEIGGSLGGDFTPPGFGILGAPFKVIFKINVNGRLEACWKTSHCLTVGLACACLMPGQNPAFPCGNTVTFDLQYNYVSTTVITPVILTSEKICTHRMYPYDNDPYFTDEFVGPPGPLPYEGINPLSRRRDPCASDNEVRISTAALVSIQRKRNYFIRHPNGMVHHCDGCDGAQP